jgi:hypothetical protein
MSNRLLSSMPETLQLSWYKMCKLVYSRATDLLFLLQLTPGWSRTYETGTNEKQNGWFWDGYNGTHHYSVLRFVNTATYFDDSSLKQYPVGSTQFSEMSHVEGSLPSAPEPKSKWLHHRAYKSKDWAGFPLRILLLNLILQYRENPIYAIFLVMGQPEIFTCPPICATSPFAAGTNRIVKPSEVFASCFLSSGLLWLNRAIIKAW